MNAVALRKIDWRTTIGKVLPWLLVAFAFGIPVSNAITNILSILIAVLALVQVERSTWLSVIKHPLSIAILIFVMINIFATIYTVAAPKELYLGLRKSVRLLFFIFFVPQLLDPKTRLNSLAAYITAVVLSVIVAIYAGGAIFKDSIFTSLFIAYAIFILAHLSFDLDQNRKICIGTAAGLTFYLLFIGYGRVGQVLFMVLSLVFLWQRFAGQWKKFTFGFSIFALLLIASVFGPSSFKQRNALAMQEIQEYLHVEEATIARESSMGTRLLLFRNSWELIKQKPIFGWGSGSYVAAYAKQAPEAQISMVRRSNPHNQYLLSWVELGLPGLVSIIYIFYVGFRTFWGRTDLSGYLGVGLVLAIALGCTINSWLLDFSSAFFFVFFLALCAAGTVRQDDKRPRTV